MAEIKVKGFCTKGETKESSKGKYSKFSLSEGQKQQDGTYKKVWYNVTNFKSATFPEDGSQVEVSGIFKMKEAQNGKTYYDILAGDDGVKVLKGPNPDFAKKDGGAQKDPWED